MSEKITYTLYTNGLGFNAEYKGHHIGEITFVRVGLNRLVIDHTAVSPDFRNAEIGLNLVRHVCDLARHQQRKIIPLCPFARAMFERYSEFDDVRLMQRVGR